MKRTFRCFIQVVVEFYGFLVLLNAITWLLNQPSTIAFFGATLLALLTCFVGYYRICAAIRYLSKEKKK